jgi:myo-inositol-1(or 4)-monophosphatase
MKAYKDLAIKAALTAGKILMDSLARGVKVGYKGKFNVVTEADHRSEVTIVKMIHDRFPSHQIIAEEGHGKGGSSKFRWLVDPLDGTTNYAHGFPWFCVSIGLEIENEIVLGVVYDPFHQEMFMAEKGRGAFLNDRPLFVSKIGKLGDSLVVTGFNWKSIRKNLEHFSHFSLRVQGVRRTGSAALDLCYVAMGRLEGYWELMLSPWDMAAGSLIVTEAGGRVTDFRGGPFSIYSKQILATNSRIHGEMLSVLKIGRKKKRAYKKMIDKPNGL